MPYITPASALYRSRTGPVPLVVAEHHPLRETRIIPPPSYRKPARAKAIAELFDCRCADCRFTRWDGMRNRRSASADCRLSVTGPESPRTELGRIQRGEHFQQMQIFQVVIVVRDLHFVLKLTLQLRDTAFGKRQWF